MKAADKILSKRYAKAYMDLGYLDYEKHGADAAACGPAEWFQGAEKSLGPQAARAKIAELEQVRNAASQFRRLLLHPLVGYDDKNEVLARLLSKELMVSRAAVFVRLLIKENRFYLLEAVLEDCMKFYNACVGVVRAEVVSRHPLSQEELSHIGKIISASTGKKAHVAEIISERVIGGVEIRLGDLLVDATVKGRLERLKSKILA
jgi:F-type H+-transporting ATPase subunit delta